MALRASVLLLFFALLASPGKSEDAQKERVLPSSVNLTSFILGLDYAAKNKSERDGEQGTAGCLF